MGEYTYDDTLNPSLGDGFNPSNPTATLGPVVTGTPTVVLGGGGAGAALTTKVVTTSSDFHESTSADIRLAASFLAFKAEAHFGFQQAIATGRSSVSLILRQDIDHGWFGLEGEKLKDGLPFQDDGPKFAAHYGSEYVYSIRKAGFVSIVYSLVLEDTAVSQQAIASIAGSSAGYSGEAKLSHFVSEAQKYGAVTLDVEVRGAESAVLAAKLKGIISADLTNYAKLQQGVAEVIGAMGDAKSGITVAFKTRSLDTFVNTVPIAQDYDNDLLEEYSDTRQRIAHEKALLERIHDGLNPYSVLLHATDLPDAITKRGRYLGSLDKGAKGYFNSLGDDAAAALQKVLDEKPPAYALPDLPPRPKVTSIVVGSYSPDTSNNEVLQGWQFDVDEKWLVDRVEVACISGASEQHWPVGFSGDQISPFDAGCPIADFVLELRVFDKFGRRRAVPFFKRLALPGYPATVLWDPVKSVNAQIDDDKPKA